MDSQFAKAYQQQNGIESQGSPFAEAYSSQNGIDPTTLTPSDVSVAQNEASNPSINPNTHDNNWNGWCQAFVEKATGSGFKAPSATSALQNYAQEGDLITDPSGMKPGNLIYFYDPNQPDGHVGIVSGNGDFISATPNGIVNQPIKDWQAKTGQQVAGFVQPQKTLPKIGGVN